MNWTGALDLVVARTGHERYRWLCSDENRDAESRDAYRALVVSLAAGETAPTPADLTLRSLVARRPCCPG